MEPGFYLDHYWMAGVFFVLAVSLRVARDVF